MKRILQLINIHIYKPNNKFYILIKELTLAVYPFPKQAIFLKMPIFSKIYYVDEIKYYFLLIKSVLFSRDK